MHNNYLPAGGTFSKDLSMFGLPDNLYVVGFDQKTSPNSKIILSNQKTYLDWVCGLGSNLLGYNNQNFIETIVEAMRKLSSFSLINRYEYLVAEKLCIKVGKLIPGFENEQLQVRFALSGTEANVMAIRLARAVTGRDLIISSGYHGYAAEFIAAVFPGHGIPKEYKQSIVSVEWGDKQAILEHIHKAAAIIIEQPPQDIEIGWYSFLREVCTQNNTLLIVDEIVTGLRYSMGGACTLFSITPDLITMGKALGNGFPVSVLMGPTKYMQWFSRDDPVFCSSTFWGEPIRLVAANFILDYWTTQHIDYLWMIGRQLSDGLNEIGWKTVGHSPRTISIFDSVYEKAFFIQRMFANGILINRPNFSCMGHTLEDVIFTLQVASGARAEWEATYVNDLRKQKQDFENVLPRILFTKR